MSTNPGPRIGDRLYTYGSPEVYTEHDLDDEPGEDLGQAERRIAAWEQEFDRRIEPISRAPRRASSARPAPGDAHQHSDRDDQAQEHDA